MARMPDLETFASPVRVEGPRAVGSYDLSPLARANAAMTAGVETLGKGLQTAGTDVAAAGDANDRYNLAMAKASFSIDHTNIQQRLAHDQDYPTLQPRYTEEAQAAQSRWAETLTNPATRARFNLETGQSIASGNATFKERAWTLEGNTKLADIDDRGKSLSDGTIADPMNEKKFGTNLEAYGDMVDAMVAKGWLTPTQAAQKKDAWAHSAGVGVGLARADIDPVGALNEVRAAPGSPDQITNRIMQVEGPGKDPRSSAVGGFIDSTWLDLLKTQRPDLAAGKSDADLLALRADAGLRKQMTDAYRNQNTAFLKGQGLEATPGNQYLAHFLGPAGAAAVLKANPNKPVADVLTDLVGPAKAQAMIDANPTVLQGKLAGSVVQWASGKMGGAIPGGGHIYDWLDDNQRRQVASYAQNKLEANQLDQQSTLKQRVEDTAAEAARTGYATNPVTQSEFVATRGILQGPKDYAQYQAGLKTAADISNLSRMTVEQQNELLKSYEPKPGEGYEAAAEREAAVRKAIVTVRKERDADPATFAINRIPAVKAAYDNFSALQTDPSATPAARSLAARDYVNKTTERQLASGVLPDDVTIVPKPYIDKLNSAFTAAADAADPKARVGLIARINQEKTLWGDSVWPDLVRQMTPGLQPMVRAIAAGADTTAMTRLLSLDPKESPAALLKEQSETKSSDVRKALNTEMAPLLSTMVGRQKDRDFFDYYNLADKLAALYVRDGKDGATAAHDAFNALIGNRYDFRDTFRIPKDPHIVPDDVQAGALVAKSMIGGSPVISSNLEQATRDLKLTPEEQALYQRHLTNLTGAGGVDNADGSRSTLFQSSVEHDGRTYNIPTVWDGKILPIDQAINRVKGEGWGKFPSYANEAEAEARYSKMHDYMDRDTGQFFDARKSNPMFNIKPAIDDVGGISDARADSLTKFKRDGVWVTSPDNGGLNLMYGDKSVRGADGGPLFLSWAQLSKMGGTPEARTAAMTRATEFGAQTP